jgi:hypothetical protein
VEGEALSGAGSDAGKPRELGDEVLDERTEHVRELCLEAWSVVGVLVGDGCDQAGRRDRPQPVPRRYG